MSYYGWAPYVSVAERRAKAQKEMQKLKKKGKDIQPIELNGRKIAASFWGKGWCDHLESFSDYENRLPRGRTYVRNGSVCHLDINAGQIDAFVSGSELYKVTVQIKPLVRNVWNAIKAKCHGQIGSILELLQGRISHNVMAVVSDPAQGLFPQPGEIQLKCSCPDWATMCKHVAAVLYGVGSRLDHRPELLFILRGVDAEELISAEVALPTTATGATADAIAEGALAGIFGVDIDNGIEAGGARSKTPHKPTTARPGATKRKAKGASPADASTAKPAKSKKPKIRKKPEPIFNAAAPTGKAIAQLRKAAGFSVADFARALAVSSQSVQRWESTPGPVRIYARPLAALAKMQENVSRS
jgi:uncharacterized Zn finger protein